MHHKAKGLKNNASPLQLMSYNKVIHCIHTGLLLVALGSDGVISAYNSM